MTTKANSEAAIHEKIVNYLRRKYPHVIFRTDFAAGLKLPIWLAARQRKLQYKRGFPDLFIYCPLEGYLKEATRIEFSGLALEIKKDGTRLRRQDGSWASQHILEQSQILNHLVMAGYACAFAVGYDQAVDLIDAYLSGNWHQPEQCVLTDHKKPTIVHEQGVF